MNKNRLSLAVGLMLIALFALMLFTFQVRQTEVALVTTFGKPAQTPETEPGLKWKLPWPIQRVLKFDNRVQNFEGKFEETQTSDGYNLLISVYAGWKIKDPAKFRNAFADGATARATQTFEERLRSEKNAVVGRHAFSHFISTDPKEMKFTEIEKEIENAVKPSLLESYGVEISFLGIKRLGLPESVTPRVFERMKEERNRFVAKLQAEGLGEATKIGSGADLERSKLLSAAEGKATEIRGQADSEAARYLEVFEKHPELALLLQRLSALESSLKNKSTLIFDTRTPPFDLLDGSKVKTTAK